MNASAMVNSVVPAAASVVLSLALGIAPQQPAAPDTSAPPQQEVLWYETTAVAPTRVFFPPEFDAGRSHTLVIALHGYGSSAEEFARIAHQLTAAGFLVALPESPYGFLVEGRLGFDWTLFHIGDDTLSNRATLPLMVEYLPAVAKDISERYSVDQIYALGFSQGAVLALGTAVFDPELFGGAVMFGLPAFQPGWIPDDALGAGRDLPLLLIHGDRDDRAPFAASEAARDFFSAAGYDVTLHGFNGGHSVPPDQLEYAARWMRQKASGYPVASPPRKPSR